MICYKNDCTTHLSRKEEEYFSKASKNYQEKKKTRWATWNTERAKISHQVNKFSEKSDDKSKLLKTEQEKRKEIKKKMKATSFWWKQKIIYNSESVAQQLASTKDSEKHHESEKSKKKPVQELSSNASEVSINQQIQIKQSSEEDNSKKMFTEKDENWYETVLQETKKTWN